MNNLELEIAQLQQRIEEKKNLLEQQGGIVEEKELVSTALGEMFTRSAGVTPSVEAVVSSSPRPVSGEGTSYLDNVDDQTAETISLLVQKLPTIGIAKVVAEAEITGPYLVDVLHDALVDKMYEELVQRGFIKTK